MGGLRAATLDNKVFLFGGYDSSDSSLDSILFYNKDRDTWQPAGNMTVPRGYPFPVTFLSHFHFLLLLYHISISCYFSITFPFRVTFLSHFHFLLLLYHISISCYFSISFPFPVTFLSHFHFL